jgi:hypothetical protein
LPEDSDENPPPISTRREVRVHGSWAVRIGEREHVAGDLSTGGLFLKEVTDLPPGTRLHLVLVLPGGGLEAEAEVRWVRAARLTRLLVEGAGLAFAPLAEADVERIRALLAERGTE